MFKKILLCVLAVAALSACGVRPKHLKAPADSTTIYPRTYPAPDDHDAADFAPGTPTVSSSIPSTH